MKVGVGARDMAKAILPLVKAATASLSLPPRREF